VCLVFSPHIASQASPASAPKHCALEGQVVQEPGGEGIKKAQVELDSEDPDNAVLYTTLTDGEGHFTIQDVKPGHYDLSSNRYGFVPVRARHGNAISLEPGQEIKDVLLRMLAAGVITGKVLDHDGDPMPRASVEVLRYGVKSPRHSLLAGIATTNDLGEYRVARLKAGRYLVLARDYLSSMMASAKNKKIINRSSEPTVSASTYYPGTIDKEQAIPLELHAGEEVNADVNMVASRVFHIRGFVSLPGFGNTTERITVQPKNGSILEYYSAGWKIEKDGSFDIADVLPGSYTFSVRSSDDDSSSRYQIAGTVEVMNKDVNNIRLMPMPDGHIVGQLRTDTGANLDWSQLSVALKSDDGSDFDLAHSFAPFADSDVKSNGSFEMKNVLPGSYHALVFSSNHASKDYFLKSVNLGGKDVSDSGFTIGGSNYSLELVMSAGGATLEGVVVDDKGNAAPDAEVIAIPEASHSQRADLFAHTSSDQNGHFRFRGLDPLEYTVLAFEDLGDADYHDPDFAKPYADNAQKVQLNASERKNIQLQVIPAGASQQ